MRESSASAPPACSWRCPRTSASACSSSCSRPKSCTEPLDEQAVAEATVADRELVAVQLVEHRPDDARTGEDHLGSRRLQPADRASPPGRSTPVEVDLAADPRPVEDRSLDADGGGCG